VTTTATTRSPSSRRCALGPVHPVRLADGHPAWLIVGYDEARAALNDPPLSKDMHAALARNGDTVAEGLPGPALARHMLAVDPPDHTRLRRLAAPAFSRRRVDGLQERARAIVAQLLDDLAARGDEVVDLVAAYAFPMPFTVVSELLGIPEPDRADLGRWFRTLLAPHSWPPPAQGLGAPLARLEGHIALGALHTRLPTMRLAVDPTELRWSHGDGLVLRGLSELPVHLV
jgi:cytochrome P450